MDQHIMNITLLQSLRSGNIFIDLLIAAMVPMLFNSVWPHIYTVWNYFRRFVKGNIKVGTYRREITYIKSSPFHDYQEEPNSNGLLQHAIRAYIGTQINNDFHSGKIRLTNIQSDKSYDYDDSYQSDSEYEGDGDSDDEDGNGGTSSSPSLKSSKQDGFQQLDLPNSDENPVEIIPGLFFSEKMISRSIGNDSESPSNNNNSKTNSNNIEVKYVFISSGYNGRKGSEVIDDFMEVVWNWYIKEVEKKEDHSRWMYQPLVKDLTISSGSKERIYKRYKLTDDKTFKSLFFSEKDRVLKLLDTFEKKEGKYAIKGFPHKLGLLLHGPPGTGKTSLVKAIASKMKRHIISIPLSRIRTNQELLDIMLDCSFKYIASSLENGDDGQGKTKRVILPYNKVIFLLEDVDAATAIVRNDEVKNNNNNNIKNNNYNTVPHLSGDSSGEVFDNNNNNNNNTPTVTTNDNEDDTTTPTERRNEDDNNYNNYNNNNNTEKQNKTESLLEKQSQHMSEIMDIMLITQRQQLHLQNTIISKNAPGEATNTKNGLDLTDLSDLITKNTDKLSLDGLLTVLDGVVDTPGRILVMTSNFPENLDNSILRPGRINMKLYMGPLQNKEMVEMLRHYYNNVSDEEVSVVVDAFRRFNNNNNNNNLNNNKNNKNEKNEISPADFEQMCAEECSIRDLVARMQRVK